MRFSLPEWVENSCNAVYILFFSNVIFNRVRSVVGLSHLSNTQKVPGSSPGGHTFFPLSLVPYFLCALLATALLTNQIVVSKR